MKKFIYKIIIFVSIITIFLTSSTIVIYLIQSKASFKLPINKHILVVGDSHTRDAIDDEIYSSAVNVSHSATAYLYSYCKIKKFLNENNHIDTILISFHYEPLTHIGDSWIFEKKSMSDKIPNYYTLLDKDDFLVFSNKIKPYFIKSMLFPPYKLVFKFVRKKYHLSYKDLDIGGCLYSKRNKLQEDIARRNHIKKEEKTGISFYQKEYIQKIVNLCKDKNVELILLNSPTYKPKIYGNISELNDYYNTHFYGVKYMDYSAFPLLDSCYGDIDHLNYKGAEIFSKYLQENFGKDIRASDNLFVYSDN